MRASLLSLGPPAALPGRPAPVAEGRAAVRRVLFLGNSFTYMHDLPGMVVRLAASADPPLRYRAGMIATGGARLSDHLGTGRLGREMARGGWDDVVIQGHSGELLPAHAAGFAPAMAGLRALVRAGRARACLLVPWAPGHLGRTTPAAFAHARAAEAAHRAAAGPEDRIARAGALWADWLVAGKGGLYGPDGHHAAPEGTFLAALAVLAALGDADPAATRWAPAGLAADRAAALRRAAARH